MKSNRTRLGLTRIVYIYNPRVLLDLTAIPGVDFLQFAQGGFYADRRPGGDSIRVKSLQKSRFRKYILKMEERYE